MDQVVPLGLFRGHCNHVLELARVFGELATMGECHEQAARVRKVEAKIVSTASAEGIRWHADGSLASPTIPWRRGGSPAPCSGAAVSAGEEEGRAATISARGLVAQLDDIRRTVRELDAAGRETRAQFGETQDAQGQELHAIRAEAQAAAAEAARLLDVVEAQELRIRDCSTETRGTRERASAALEAADRAGTESEACRARATTSAAELREAVGDLGAEVFAIRESVTAFERAEQEKRAQIAREVGEAVAELGKTVSQRTADFQRDVDFWQGRMQDEHRQLNRRASECEASMGALESELKQVREACIPCQQSAASTWPGAAAPSTVPSPRTTGSGGTGVAACGAAIANATSSYAWRAAIEDALRRVQADCDEAARLLQERQRQADVKLSGRLSEQAAVASEAQRVAGLALGRADGAEASARSASQLARGAEEAAQRVAQRLATELRDEWRAELRAAAGAWLSRAAAATGEPQAAEPSPAPAQPSATPPSTPPPALVSGSGYHASRGLAAMSRFSRSAAAR